MDTQLEILRLCFEHMNNEFQIKVDDTMKLKRYLEYLLKGEK